MKTKSEAAERCPGPHKTTHTQDSLPKGAKANNAQRWRETEQPRRKEKIKEKRRLGNQKKKRRRNQKVPKAKGGEEEEPKEAA